MVDDIGEEAMTMDWKKNFREKFAKYHCPGPALILDCDFCDIESFIENLLAEQKKEIFSTIPNPSYSQSEVDRIWAERRQQTIEDCAKVAENISEKMKQEKPFTTKKDGLLHDWLELLSQSGKIFSHAIRSLANGGER